jgi:hypothetical protein
LTSGSTGILLALSALLFPLLAVRPLSAAEVVCSDPAVIFCDDFESGNLSLWQDGFDPSLHRITSAPSNVYRGHGALEATYPAGSDGGWLTRWFMPGYTDVYARLYVKFESGWRCGQNCTKIMALYGNRIDNRWSGFGKAGIRPTGTDFFISMLVTLNWYRPPDPGEVIFYAYFPEMARAPDGMFWGNFFYQNDPREPLQTARWYCLELELKANAPGLRDGLQRMWIDDVFKGEVPNMRWRDTTDVRINAFQLTFSGSVPSTEHVWIDNVVVGTKRIGCASAGTPPAAPPALKAR